MLTSYFMGLERHLPVTVSYLMYPMPPTAWVNARAWALDTKTVAAVKLRILAVRGESRDML